MEKSKSQKQSSKKRKKCRESSDQSSSQSSDHEPSVVSQLLNRANSVFYEDIPLFRDNLPVTSTPLNKSVGLSVDEKLDYIMKKLQLLDGIAESINKLYGRVTTMERRVDLFESKNTEFEKTIDFVANKVDEFEKQCKRATEQIKKMQ